MRNSIFNLVKTLKSRGFNCVINNFDPADELHGFGCAILHHPITNKLVSIYVMIHSGIKVFVSTDKYDNLVVVDNREVLTDEDFNKILFYLN